MRVLLDTHALIWFVNDDPLLSLTARNAIIPEENRVFFSLVSAWEIAIKVGIGRLDLGQPLESFLPDQLRRNGIELLPIELQHVLAVADLPRHHRDPFDRLLIAQAITENLPIVSSDAAFDRYPVQRIW